MLLDNFCSFLMTALWERGLSTLVTTVLIRSQPALNGEFMQLPNYQGNLICAEVGAGDKVQAPNDNTWSPGTKEH